MVPMGIVLKYKNKPTEPRDTRGFLLEKNMSINIDGVELTAVAVERVSHTPGALAKAVRIERSSIATGTEARVAVFPYPVRVEKGIVQVPEAALGKGRCRFSKTSVEFPLAKVFSGNPLDQRLLRRFRVAFRKPDGSLRRP